MKTWLQWSLIFGVVFAGFSEGREAKDYLSATEVPSAFASIDDSIAALVFSESYTNQVVKADGSIEARILTGQDLNEYEIAAIQEFTAKKGDQKKKKILLVRYGIEIGKVGDCIEAAVCQSIPATIVTDLNRALINEGEKKTADFGALAFNSTEMAKIIKKLLAHMEYNADPNGILSIPVYPNAVDRMKPIMHLKILLLIDENQSPPQIEMIHGTNNLSNADRVNTLLKNADPVVAQYYLEHIDALTKVLAAGGDVKDMPQIAPMKVTYPDGYRILRFTDGQHNPNDSIADFLLEAAKPENGIAIRAVHGQEFVLTHRRTVDAMKELMAAQSDFHFNLIADSRFVSLDGYGLASIFEGFNIYPDKGGKPVYGVNKALQDRSNIYVYSALGRNADGSWKVEKDLNEAHITRKLEHNKILIVTYVKNGEERARIYFGSMNLSNHFDNAEDQEEIDVPVTSWIYKALIQDFESIRQTQPQNVLDLPIHLVREGLGRLTGHTDLEVPLDLANRAYAAALTRDYKTFMAAIHELAGQPSNLTHRPELDEVQKRLKRLEDFLAWYGKSVPTSAGLSDQVRLHKLISVSLVLSQPQLPSWKVQSILNSVLWRPNMDEQDLQSAIRAGWKALGVDGEPVFRPREAVTTDTDSAAAQTYGRFTFWNFDWDDNVMYMPTTITLFKMGSDERWDISTKEFAHARFLLGKRGSPYETWEIRRTPTENSFYRFGSKYTGNYFLDDVIKAIHGLTSTPDAWQGPSWKAFVAALSRPETAANVRIVTARNHSAKDMLEGLKELQRLGLIKYLPKLENFHGVGGAGNLSERKVARLVESIMEAESQYYPNDLPESISASGHGKRKQILWGFSDDDYGNYLAAKSAIMALMKENKIKKTKITLYFTGLDNPEHRSEIKVITPKGEERDLLPGEETEIELFLNRSKTGEPCDALLGSQKSSPPPPAA